VADLCVTTPSGRSASLAGSYGPLGEAEHVRTLRVLGAALALIGR
jgi:hypothetical protein